jgi:hypothetical protein
MISEPDQLQLFRYADGEMEPQERARFEDRLADEADLAEAFERLLAIESRAKQAYRARPFSPPSAEVLPIPSRTFAFRRWAAMAALLLIGTLAVFVWTNPSRSVPSLREVHRSVLAEFKPEIVCDTPEKFLAYTTESLGVAIAADFSSRATLVGWSPVPGLTYMSRARVLLARDNQGRPVMVVFAHGDDLPTGGSAADRSYSASFGGITAIELGYDSGPAILPLLSLAEPG